MEPMQYQNEDFCEDYSDYGPGGYYPASLGEIFNEKYEIIQKLGWGNFSTVWLIKNIQTEQHSALKIQRNKSTHTLTAIQQIQLLKILRIHKEEPQWLEFLENKFRQHSYPIVKVKQIYQPLILVENFFQAGPTGLGQKHSCSVFQLLGPNLLEIIQHYEFKSIYMPMNLIKRIIRDVLIGLVYINKFCKMIHTDLKPENIVMKLNEESENKCIEALKIYNKKPISMKYLQDVKQNKIYLKKSKEEQRSHQRSKQFSISIHESQQFFSAVGPFSENSNKKEQDKQIPKKKKPWLDKFKFCMCQHQEDNTKYTPSKNISNYYSNGLSTGDKAQKKKQHQQLDTNDLFQKKNYTKQEIENMEWRQAKINLTENFSFKIADFGNATLHEKHASEDIQTRQYRSPEVILGYDYEYNTDIWSLACIIFQMLTNNFLFKPSPSKTKSKSEDHIFKMMEILGPMKKNYLLGGKNSSHFVNKKGQLKHGNPKKTFPLNEILHRDFNYTQQQARQIQQFLKPMLQFQPCKRADAEECLKSQWLWKQ